VRSPSVVVANALPKLWERCIRTDAVGASVEVYVPECGSLAAELAWVSSEVTLQAIGARAGELWMLHAGGVADPTTGATIALVGPSGAGKTTATRVLAQEFGYVSDETVGIDTSGAVLPYPKPLSVVESDKGHKRQVSPTDLGLLEPPETCTLAGLVLVNRVDGTTLDVRRVPTGEALVRLAEQTSYVARMDSPLRTMAGHVERVGGAVEVTYSEAADLVPVVRQLMGGR
jgi:hypothetical protein